MKAAQIQTLHPRPGKTNKCITLDKYNVMKENILSILKKAELTHTELMEKLYNNLKDSFEGGVQWYGYYLSIINFSDC
jgi:putative methionine-R-sulfoxide reductase with GAF domain